MSHECKTSRRGWCISGMRPPRVPFLFLSTTAAASSAWVSEWSQWPNNPQWAYSMSIIKPLSFEATELWDLFVLQQNLNYPDWCTSYITLNELLIFSEPQFLHLQYHGDMKMIFLHLGLRNQKKIISIEYLAEPPTFDSSQSIILIPAHGFWLICTLAPMGFSTFLSLLWLHSRTAQFGWGSWGLTCAVWHPGDALQTPGTSVRKARQQC